MTPRRIGDLTLTIGALLGTLCIVATIAAIALEVRPLVFRSGSMSPEIDTGALALARTVDAADLRVGDVVSVTTTAGVRITHRVESLTRVDDEATLVLRGDANPTSDTEPYVVRSAERVFFDVPFLGYAVAWASGPVGVFLGGLLVGGILISSVRRMRHDGPGGRRRAAATLAVVALGAGASVTVGPQRTLASFTDTAAMSSDALTSYKVPVPATFTCGALGVLSVRFDWTAVAGATSYTVHYGAAGATTRVVAAPATTTTIVSVISGGTAWVEANRAFTSTTWTSTPSVTRTYTVAAVSLCA